MAWVLLVGEPIVSFGTPGEDQMSIAASESGLLSFGEEDEVEIPPSGVVTRAELDSELAAMLAGPPRASDSRGTLHLDRMIGSWVLCVVHSRVPPQCLS